ncbi:hypothetical protein [Lacticaseibacillus absianus]|uniref:hypothetical protein n=1 Tax=Lacticaseibacillus absianus TaxID=2729623 RepID=UPI0015CD054F|nr:hypothetical protein [Lacticaseibacillus absianus]
MGLLDDLRKTAQDAAKKVTTSDAYAKLTSDESKAAFKAAGRSIKNGVVTGTKTLRDAVKSDSTPTDHDKDDLEF